jgi:inosine-uridine nucleoside N-ribohydrolase
VRIQGLMSEKVNLSCEYSAVELLAETINSSSEKISFLALGPLTNLAELFLTYPDLVQKIDRIYIMGGHSKFLET